MEGDDLHECTEFDQLNTCVECGEPKNPMPESRRTGGAGSLTAPLSDEDYRRQRRKLERLNAADSRGGD